MNLEAGQTLQCWTLPQSCRTFAHHGYLRTAIDLQSSSCRLETADFEKNDLYVVQYKHIKEKLRDRYVQLI